MKAVTPLRRAPTPKTLQVGPLTYPRAAERYKELKPLLDVVLPEFEEAEGKLKDYFDRHPTHASYKGIGWKPTGGQTYLDQAAVREYLGDKVKEFLRRAKTGRALFLLK